MSDIPAGRKYIQSSGLANDLLIGIADGMMLPFALAAMLSFIVSKSEIVFWICILESILLAGLFGIASYLNVVNQTEEYPEENNPAPHGNFIPHLQLQKIIANLDLGPEIARRAAEEGDHYQTRWNALLASHNLGEAKPDFRKAKRSGFYTTIAFLAGSIFPVISYVFSSSPVSAFRYSAIITASGLIVFGFCKAIYTGRKPWSVIWRLVSTGVILTAAALLLVWFLKV